MAEGYMQTLGLGDIPVNENIKLFLIFYVTISTLVVAFAFENFTSMRPKMELRRKKQSVLLNQADLVAIIDKAREVMGQVGKNIDVLCVVCSVQPFS